MKFTYDYPRPMVSVDCIVFRQNGDQTEILLIRRGNEPYMGMYAFPGGFIEMEESLEASAIRELHEETGIQAESMEQFRAYGKPGRDPRGRTISVVFYCKVAPGTIAKAGDDAAETMWINVHDIPQLAFDHNDIIRDFLKEGRMEI
jgi:8-oxo-dGTP diphosphatase